MAYPTRAKGACAALLSVSLSLALLVSTVPFAGAAGSVFGTIQVSGPAWVASSSSDWSKLSTTRPLVAGDRLRTGSDGYLLADLGESGVVGLYGDAEISASDAADGPVIDVHKGKVAFHLSPDSKMQLQAKGAGIASDTAAADGYIEYGADGVPVVVVEDGSLSVNVAGADRKLMRGEKLALNSAGSEPIRMAANDDESKKAAATATGKSGGGKTYGGISGAGWTAIGAVVALTGGAVGLAVSDDEQNDNDDNGSD